MNSNPESIIEHGKYKLVLKQVQGKGILRATKRNECMQMVLEFENS